MYVNSMSKCSCCRGDIIAEKEGIVSLPCGHTLHPICHLHMYDALDKDDLPVDFKKIGVCVLCVLKPEKIIRDEEESVIDNMDVGGYNMRTACLIVTDNTVVIRKDEVTDTVAGQVLTKYKGPLGKFKAAAKTYGAKRWKLEQLIQKRGQAILKEVQGLVEFTIKRLTDEAYNDIIAGGEFLEFVKADREYVKHLNGLQFIDPIQYFQKDVVQKTIKGLKLNSYTSRAIIEDILGDFSKRYTRSNLRSYLRPIISLKS